MDVPNAPCGVESKFSAKLHQLQTEVPNAPCGVESINPVLVVLAKSFVPNAPCGVESFIFFNEIRVIVEFLMHRVELKG